MAELLAAALLVAALVGIVTLRLVAVDQWRRDLVAYELRFPRDVEPADIVRFVSGLSGLAGRWFLRWLEPRAVVFESTGTTTGIRSGLLMRSRDRHIVDAALCAALPGVVVETVDAPLAVPTLATSLRLTATAPPLRTEPAAALPAAVLATLQPLNGREAVTVQWIAQPLGPRGGDALVGWRRRFDRQTPDADQRRARRAKQELPLFAVTGRIGVTATPDRARALLRRVTSAYHLASVPGVHLARQFWPSLLVARFLSRRLLPLGPAPCLLNARELAQVAALPVAGVAVPGLPVAGCRSLVPSTTIPRHGRVLAYATYPGAERPLALGALDSLRHLHVIGPTGVGKSTLLLNLITQDMVAGRGLVVIDPQGDLVANALDRIPPKRLGDVVVLDPADEARPVGFDLFAGATRVPELIVDQLVAIFHNLFRSSWGPRTADVLRATLLTLASQPGMTLCDVPRLLTDPSLRRRLVGQVDDPIGLEPFWAWYEALSDSERGQVIGPVSNKLRAVLLHRQLRNVLGQAEPLFDLGRAIDTRALVFVVASKGRLGPEAASLFGSLLVARLWQGVTRRSARPTAARTPLHIYIDEAQDFLHGAVSVSDMLAQARGYGLALTLSHQHLGQLPADLRDAVLANARSRVIFQTSADDARALARELAPHLAASDLQGLATRQVVLSLCVGDHVVPPTTGRTLPPPPTTGTAAAARRASRLTFGRDRDEVEASIRARYQRVDDDSIGRGPRRRSA